MSSPTSAAAPPANTDTAAPPKQSWTTRLVALVRDGSVDLTAIKYVRIVDIVGDGTTLDSFGRGIVDPISSGPTAGFDLDGIAVLNAQGSSAP